MVKRPNNLPDLLRLVDMSREVELAKLAQAYERLAKEEEKTRQIQKQLKLRGSATETLETPDVAQLCSADQKWMDWCRRDLQQRNLVVAKLRERVESQKQQAQRAFGKAMVLRQITSK